MLTDLTPGETVLWRGRAGRVPYFELGNLTYLILPALMVLAGWFIVGWPATAGIFALAGWYALWDVLLGPALRGHTARTTEYLVTDQRIVLTGKALGISFRRDKPYPKLGEVYLRMADGGVGTISFDYRGIVLRRIADAEAVHAKIVQTLAKPDSTSASNSASAMPGAAANVASDPSSGD